TAIVPVASAAFSQAPPDCSRCASDRRSDDAHKNVEPSEQTQVPQRRIRRQAAGESRAAGDARPGATVSPCADPRTSPRPRLRAGHDCAALLLYDPVNIHYALDCSNMQVWCLHNPVRYALIFADGPGIMFEFKGCEHLCRGLETIDEVRPAIACMYMTSGNRLPERVSRWADEIAGLVRAHGGGNRRIAVGRLDVAGLRALESRGLAVVDAGPMTEHARALKSDDEIALMRWTIRVCEAGMARIYEHSVPGVTEQELWAHLHFENARSGGEWLETRLL